MPLSKYYTYSIKDFEELHKEFNSNASDYTLKTFVSSLIRIEKVYNDKLENLQLKYLEDVDDLEKKLNKNYKKNSVLSTIASLSKLNRMIDNSLIIQNDFKKKIKDLKEEIDKSSETQQINESRLNQYVEFNKILEKINEIYDSYLLKKKTLPQFRKFLILCLFSLQIPTRIQNYLNMLIIKTNNNINLEDFKDKNNNYLIIENLNNYTFIFNRYKTNNKYGSKIIKVENNKLINLLNKWFNEYNIKCKTFLINENGRELTQKLFTKDLKEITSHLFENEGFSVDVLRSSFITELYNTNPQYRLKCKIADLMGHSVNTSELNYKKVIKDTDRDNLGLPIFNN